MSEDREGCAGCEFCPTFSLRRDDACHQCRTVRAALVVGIALGGWPVAVLCWWLTR